MAQVIPFPNAATAETVQAPIALFTFNETGQVDLAEGVSVSDAVVALWEALGPTVAQAWADSPLGREKARTHVLTAFLDRRLPGWREELSW